MSLAQKKNNNNNNSNDRNSRKRKATNPSNYRKAKKALRPPPPALGGPGILLTCDTGREVKCEREGLQILEYYYYINKSQDKNSSTSHQQSHDQNLDEADSTTPNPTRQSLVLSLEEELAQLRQAASRKGTLQSSSSPSSPFAVYDTGCRGTVLILFNQTKIQPASEQTHDDATTHSNNTSKTQERKEPVKEQKESSRNEKNNKLHSDTDEQELDDHALKHHHHDSEANTTTSSTWDALDTVYSIVQDMKQIKYELSSNTATTTTATEATTAAMIPSSRFITRMIPIQATCAAKVDALQDTVRLLLKPIFLQQQQQVKCELRRNVDKKDNNEEAAATTTTTTFAIQPKRRNCSHLTSKNIIDVVANIIDEYCKTCLQSVQNNPTSLSSSCWKADLRDPDYSIAVEVCRTVCGVSVVPRRHAQQAKHYNIAEIRAQSNHNNNDNDNGGGDHDHNC